MTAGRAEQLGEQDLALLTIAEAADVAEVPPATIRKWVSRYALPTVRSASLGLLVSEAALLECERARRLQPRGRRRAA